MFVFVYDFHITFNGNVPVFVQELMLTKYDQDDGEVFLSSSPWER